LYYLAGILGIIAIKKYGSSLNDGKDYPLKNE
jgi:hypothetical protein